MMFRVSQLVIAKTNKGTAARRFLNVGTVSQTVQGSVRSGNVSNIGQLGELTLHRKKGTCHLFCSPLEKGDSPLFSILHF